MTGSQRAVLGLVGGMLAGLISVIGNNPFDVVKTRMQGPRAVEYKNTLDCFRHMLLHEGASSFYTGVVPRLGRTIPGQGVIFMSYDTITLFVSRYIEA
ncbi:Tricarboxylate transporter [Phytophthora megakarya]|uniref:Tricarboxylate transporter n=1 Tax=Phytophthora megakarya TaxID=4795 RepID=A0A225V2H7_9STRA|nr:Tricarboxylate transporter [Phytophthora megakarya]